MTREEADKFAYDMAEQYEGDAMILDDILAIYPWTRASCMRGEF